MTILALVMSLEVIVQPDGTCGADADWKRVLALAESVLKTPPADLRLVADATDDSPSTQLARLIVSKWSDRRGGQFRAAHPALLKQMRFTEYELRTALPPRTESRSVVVEVAVDASGCASDIRFLKGANEEPLANLISRRVKATYFVPAKPGAKFVAAKAHLVLRLEAG